MKLATRESILRHDAADSQVSLLASIVESCDDAIIAQTVDGIVTSWNRGAELIYGYSPGEMIGKPVSLLGHPDRPDEMSDVLKKVRNGERVEHYETIQVRSDGRVISVLLTVSPIHRPDGALFGVSSIARDITERKQAEERAGIASQYARSLIEASLDPLVTISPEGKITDVNESSIKVTGVAREKLIGTDFSDYFTEPEKARQGYRQVFAKGFVTDYPLTIRHRDGRRTDVLYNASVYKDARDNVLGVFAAARDVTWLNQAGEERSRPGALVDTTMDAIIGKSIEGTVTSWTRGAERMFGYAAAEIVGHHVSMLIPLHLKAEEQEILDTLGRGERVEPYETQRIRKMGEIFDVSLTVSSVQDTADSIVGASEIARDITVQKQASRYARSLIEASLDPLVMISPEGKITDVNEGSIKVTGIAREKLIGADFCDYFTEPEKAREVYQQVFSQGFVTDYPLTIRHRDGKHTNVLYNASVYKDVRGNVLGVFAAARDVTAQRKAEAEVADQRTKELERLADLERFQKLTVGRELRMIELKKEIADLKKLVPPGRLTP